MNGRVAGSSFILDLEDVLLVIGSSARVLLVDRLVQDVVPASIGFDAEDEEDAFGLVGKGSDGATYDPKPSP